MLYMYVGHCLIWPHLFCDLIQKHVMLQGVCSSEMVLWSGGSESQRSPHKYIHSQAIIHRMSGVCVEVFCRCCGLLTWFTFLSLTSKKSEKNVYAINAKHIQCVCSGL